ncbi:Rhodanese-related sulfurtransferase [Actinopolymorpha cephalotaxi]|uniref:Rhodanese-related sulfurtransferase n=1 Tax=Actinopolymorpha cephalotaxi TaxID=504797 RepID=A0A1I3C2L6_9ACTN|nr:rhodanese-like domain-containing protein [Actinopolymorpha cephalotaxi]NYH84092.1 rhodanese-related sulfurtransferase [Actinopolymorpha cephalotaxi]SFH68653.1 Rhodanese-related sulfurtransferase [Actinopolymorpha cephalotaxi]
MAPNRPDATPEVDLDQLAAALGSGAALIDVREMNEYVAGHVPGAVLIPMGQLPTRLGELTKHAPIYVICASGNRSAAMTDFLNRTGFDAYSVAGGTKGWAHSRRPVDTGMPRHA